MFDNPTGRSIMLGKQIQALLAAGKRMRTFEKIQLPLCLLVPLFVLGATVVLQMSHVRRGG